MNLKHFLSHEDALNDLVYLLLETDVITQDEATAHNENHEDEFKTVPLDSPRAKPVESIPHIPSDLLPLEYSGKHSAEHLYLQLLILNEEKLASIISYYYLDTADLTQKTLAILSRAIKHLCHFENGMRAGALLYLYSARNPEKNAISTLLINHNSNLHFSVMRQETEMTALLQCLFFNKDPQLIQLMLKQGASIDENQSAIRVALKHCSPEICSLLLNHDKEATAIIQSELIEAAKENAKTTFLVPSISGQHYPENALTMLQKLKSISALLEQKNEPTKPTAENPSVAQAHHLLDLASQTLNFAINTAITLHHKTPKPAETAKPSTRQTNPEASLTSNRYAMIGNLFSYFTTPTAATTAPTNKPPLAIAVPVNQKPANSLQNQTIR